MSHRAVSSRRLCAILLLLCTVVAPPSIAKKTEKQASLNTHEPLDEPEYHKVFRLPTSTNPSELAIEPSEAPPSNEPSPIPPAFFPTQTNVLHDLQAALSAMQERYFTLWLGKYTSAIDWTAAVMSTHLTSTLSSLSRSIDYTIPGTFDKSRKLDAEAQMMENEINKYFTQSVGYYFGEDHFAIRLQAFDDMLWVVLGWLEATRFIEQHSASHYTARGFEGKGKGRTEEWYARQFIPAFAHRARIFYDLAEQGWDWRLCGGGMTWNPRLLPYKNAITNQLFISASVGMYLYFPGDDNCSPFLSQYDKPSYNRSTPYPKDLHHECDKNSRGHYDPVYLANAMNGYEWLRNIRMKNEQGLYVDGFHISGYRLNHSKTTCDERNEMVYTYNQGVILSGLRGLWEATGNLTYLEDGHKLVRNVIRATGWTKSDIFSTPSFSTQHPQRKSKSKGSFEEECILSSDGHSLGSHGILTELCDPSGLCNQNGQTFKGIFFHHLTSFCAPLPTHPARRGKTHAATREIAEIHHRSCDSYALWVLHNARAALRTRDSSGRFGSWWGATFLSKSKGDANDRGRGRTLETQGSGVAVVRAMLEFLRWSDRDIDFDL